MQLGSLTSWILELERQAGAFVGRTENYVINQLVSFRDKRGELNFQISKLKKNAPLTTAPENVKAEYVTALAEAEAAKQKVEWLGKIADQFTAITGLGALPVLIAGIPVAVMLAGIVSLTYIINSAVNHVSRYINAKSIAEAENARGGNGAQAAANYLKSAGTGGGLFGDISTLIWPLAITAGLYLLISDTRGKRGR